MLQHNRDGRNLEFYLNFTSENTISDVAVAHLEVSETYFLTVRIIDWFRIWHDFEVEYYCELKSSY